MDEFESVLSNQGTSKVFYALINGKTTPKEMAEDLGIKPPAVIEQLHRLRKVKLVKLGKKDGKYQRYEVDQETLMNLFLKDGTWHLNKMLIDITVYPKDGDIKKQLNNSEYWRIFTEEKALSRKGMVLQFKRKLKQNKEWKQYLLLYMKHHALFIGLTVIPIYEAILDFENGLRLRIFNILNKFDLETWDTIKESTRELLKLLHIWSILIQKTRSFAEGAHDETLREIVGWEIASTFKEMEARR